jgi:predicted amidohydrolase
MTACDCRVAALQMISGPRVGDNLQRAGELARAAAADGAQLLVLPEYFPIISADDAERVAASEQFGAGLIQDWLAATARELGVWLCAGSIPLRAEASGKMHNSCLLHDPSGRCVARYDKIHLFGFRRGEEHYDEAATIEAGSQPLAVDTPFGRIGLAICYDLRFPELFRSLGTPDLILLPAAFTDTTGQAHWEILLRARAIENQCYLLAVGQGGRHENGRLTHGNSMLIDPWGEVLARQDKGEGVVVGELHHARIAAVRQSLPALAHRVL